MFLPTLSGTARLTSDGELRYTAAGKAVYSVNLAFNARRKDNNGEWVDGDSFFVKATMFDKAAENAAESFSKGLEVVVTGRLKTEQWESRDGEKRSAPALMVDAIGPVVRWDPVKVLKADRIRGGESASASDPWGSAPQAPARQGASGFDEPPPF